jgi:hypothetical protein
VLYEAYDAAIQEIAAKPFEKPPVIAAQDQLDPRLLRILKDADRCGQSLSVFSAQVYGDAVDRGLGLFLVDNVPTTKADGSTMRLDEAEAADARPYFARIDPDNLIGFKSERRLGREVCVDLRVRDWVFELDSVTGVEKRVQVIRHYDSVNVETWKQDVPGTADFRLVGTRQHGFPNGEIPIVVVYTKRTGFLQAKPPLQGLAMLNIRHWNQQSVLDAGVRHNLCPTLFGSGVSNEDRENPPKLGEGSSLMTTDPNADLRYVEISGSSFEVGRKEIEKTEQRMRARAVEPLLAGSATATGEVRAEMRDQSQAQLWIEQMEWALWHAFEIAAQWIGVELPQDFNVTLHRASSLMAVANPARTQALQADVDKGRLTLVTYLSERARSGDFADDFNPKAEAEALQEQAEQDEQRRMEATAAMLAAEEAKAKEQPPADDDDDEDQKPPPAKDRAA